MAFITNGYDRKPAQTVIQIAREHLGAVTDYPLIFVGPTPTQAVLQDSIDAAAAAILDASSGDKYKIEIKKEKMSVLIDNLHQRGLWVNLLAVKDRSIAVASKLPMAKIRTPLPPITVVVTPKLTNGANQGQVNVKGKPIAGATYHYLYTTDVSLPMEQWDKVECTQVKCTIKNLASATRYYFAIAALGKNEQKVYSGYATIVTQ
jgi:hypothetical protein